MTRYNAAVSAEYSATGGSLPWPDTLHAWSAVGLLLAASCLSNVDRAILSLMIDPIKHSLQLSDTRIGLLQSAFGLFFTLTTFPAGWLTDKGNRMRLIGGAIAVWSIMTALCGMCANFTQLFLARMGVAVGEATVTPAAPSVIADNFPPERRTLPLSLYGMAAATGVGISLIAGGFVASLVRSGERVSILGVGAFEPWQIIFFAVGLPGLLLSLLFLLAREPQRRDRGQPEGTLHELLEVLKSRRAILIPHFAGVSVYFIQVYANYGWLPAFFMRVHSWSMSTVGLKYGAIHLTCVFAGGWSGGWLAQKLWRRGRRDANLLTSAIMVAIIAVPAVLAPLVPNVIVSVALFALATMFSVGTAGPNVAAIQEIIPNRLRGRVTALYFAAITLVGGMIGPLLIGVLNDYVFTDVHSLGKSLSLTALLTLPLGSVLIFIAARRRTKLDWTN
jgi:MFS family permease